MQDADPTGVNTTNLYDDSTFITSLNAANSEVWINSNANPSGVVTINRTAGENQTLTAAIVTLEDVSGMHTEVELSSLTPTNTQILSAELEETTDGAVDISDVISQLRHIVGLTELTGLNKAAADNDANGSVDISDVISSLRQIVGLQEAPNARIVDAQGNHQFMFDDSVTELYVVAAGDADLSWTPLELV
jgi:hypothetical protein